MDGILTSFRERRRMMAFPDHHYHFYYFVREKFESPADAGLSNRSIGAEAPAAAFGKTASADFASARYKHGTQSFVP
jgi:hypothetical protein